MFDKEIEKLEESELDDCIKKAAITLLRQLSGENFRGILPQEDGSVLLFWNQMQIEVNEFGTILEVESGN